MVKTSTQLRKGAATVVVFLGGLVLGACGRTPTPEPFRVEEATIADLHQAIKNGQTSCRAVVQTYIDRARAYNGVCTALITADGEPIPPAVGAVRTGTPLTFPTETVAVSSVFPDYEKYEGLPLELGRMEPTASDPSVLQQLGMRVGIRDAGQLNALETLNIRGERSVTCKGAFDRPPSEGPLPQDAPPECEAFRRQPDALERAAELDARYGSNPDLEEMPMYCVVISFKNWYDATDLRSTGGDDVNFAMDAAKEDSPDIADLRAKGAIIYGVSNAEGRGLWADARGDSGGPATPRAEFPEGNLAYGVWGGQPCNPYDTERVPRGSSSGSGVSVAANLAACGICEQSGASCKGPASRNNIVNLLTTKGILMDGGQTSKSAGDRAGIHCRTVEDAVTVLDAIKGYESSDMFTAIPKGLIPQEPYRSFLVDDAAAGQRPLHGLRIGIVREFMVKHSKNDAAISDQIDQEIKTVLRDKLGADLVESVDPLYPDDPTVANMKYTFRDALAEVLSHNVPEYFWQRRNGRLEFEVPGWDVASVDYMVALSLGKAPLSEKITLRRISSGLGNPSSPYAVNKYLAQRGDARVTDWATWMANVKWAEDNMRAAAENLASDQDPRQAQHRVSYLKMQAVLRMAVLKVMYENQIDVFVNPEQTLPPYRLGGPPEPLINDRPAHSCCSQFTAVLGGPEIEVPAGYTDVVYEPQYALAPDRKSYVSVAGDVESRLRTPMPISLMFWGGPGTEPALIRAASAYEVATRHRIPPPAFGPLPVRE